MDEVWTPYLFNEGTELNHHNLPIHLKGHTEENLCHLSKQWTWDFFLGRKRRKKKAQTQMYSPDPFEQTHPQETLPPDMQTINEGPWSHFSIKEKKSKDVPRKQWSISSNIKTSRALLAPSSAQLGLHCHAVTSGRLWSRGATDPLNSNAERAGPLYAWRG